MIRLICWMLVFACPKDGQSEKQHNMWCLQINWFKCGNALMRCLGRDDQVAFFNPRENWPKRQGQHGEAETESEFVVHLAVRSGLRHTSLTFQVAMTKDRKPTGQQVHWQTVWAPEIHRCATVKMLGSPKNGFKTRPNHQFAESGVFNCCLGPLPPDKESPCPHAQHVCGRLRMGYSGDQHGTQQTFSRSSSREVRIRVPVCL